MLSHREGGGGGALTLGTIGAIGVDGIGVRGGALTLGASRAGVGASISIDFSGLSFALILCSS